MKDPRIKVGNDGVGLVLEGVDVDDKLVGHRIRYVVTAVQFLPRLPPPNRLSHGDTVLGVGRLHDGIYEKERIYQALLGPRGNHATTVSAECVFADVVSEIAVLIGLDQQTFKAEADAYVELVSSVSPLTVSYVGPDPEALEIAGGREITGALEIKVPGGADLMNLLPGWLLRQVVQAYHNLSDERPGSHRPS